MKEKWKLFCAFLLLSCSLLFVVGLSNSASATVPLICTWTGAATLNSTDLSVAGNWSPNSGGNCGGTSMSLGSATLSGAQLVFPATNSNSIYSLSIDEPEHVDDVVFQTSYYLVGSNVLTLSPANNAGIGIDAVSGTSTINAPVTLGQSQTFQASAGNEVELIQPVSGGSYSLTIGDTAESGMIYLGQSSSYSGGTTIALGVLQIGSSGSLGSLVQLW